MSTSSAFQEAMLTPPKRQSSAIMADSLFPKDRKKQLTQDMTLEPAGGHVHTSEPRETETGGGTGGADSLQRGREMGVTHWEGQRSPQETNRDGGDQRVGGGSEGPQRGDGGGVTHRGSPQNMMVME